MSRNFHSHSVTVPLDDLPTKPGETQTYFIPFGPPVVHSTPENTVPFFPYHPLYSHQTLSTFFQQPSAAMNEKMWGKEEEEEEEDQKK